jgi:hypothetical protein
VLTMNRSKRYPVQFERSLPSKLQYEGGKDQQRQCNCSPTRLNNPGVFHGLCLTTKSAAVKMRSSTRTVRVLDPIEPSANRIAENGKRPYSVIPSSFAAS